MRVAERARRARRKADTKSGSGYKSVLKTNKANLKAITLKNKKIKNKNKVKRGGLFILFFLEKHDAKRLGTVTLLGKADLTKILAY